VGKSPAQPNPHPPSITGISQKRLLAWIAVASVAFCGGLDRDTTNTAGEAPRWLDDGRLTPTQSLFLVPYLAGTGALGFGKGEGWQRHHMGIIPMGWVIGWGKP
jgi:hypothetical protein